MNDSAVGQRDGDLSRPEERSTGPGNHDPRRRRAALFDMDKTLITRNSATLYKRYERDLGEAPLSDLIRLYFWLFQYSFGWIDAERTATQVISQYAGTQEAKLVARCNDWYPRYVRRYVAKRGREAVERHRARGDWLAIVTASTQYASAPLARELAMDAVVATELELDQDRVLTGRYLSPLCFGQGKVERTRQALERVGLRLGDAAFYTDSVTDLPLLEAVAEPYVVNPDPRLRRIAETRGYPILSWT